MSPIWPFRRGSDNSAHGTTPTTKSSYYTQPSRRDTGMYPDHHRASERGAPIESDQTHVGDISTVEIARGRMGSHEPYIERPVSTPPFFHHPTPTQHPRAPQSAPSGEGQGVEIVSATRREHGEARSRRDETTGTILVRQLEQKNSDLTMEVSHLMEEKRNYVARINELENEIRTRLGQGSMVGPTMFGVASNLTSTADVRRMIESLEDEIHQTAATLADSDFRRQSNKGPPGRQVMDAEPKKNVVNILGGELVGLLLPSGGSRTAPAILVQIALQAVISAWSWSRLGAWDLNHYRDASLTELYAEICRSEDPRDAARWRAMARKQLIRHASQTDLASSLSRYIKDVLILSDGEPASRKQMETHSGGRIAAVVQIVVELNREIGVNIISDDLEATFVFPGTPFEPKTMESMWPEDDLEGIGSGQPEIVVCTTAVGLQRRSRRGDGGATVAKTKVLRVLWQRIRCLDLIVLDVFSFLEIPFF
ncbi:hypothetical protein B0H11DRAFT_2269152 [Mycena galericulata]|nr:hypothetical protein B0H11DRAFT_2269152 [Mycena galericulata]